jgi:hypothetical protein
MPLRERAARAGLKYCSNVMARACSQNHETLERVHARSRGKVRAEENCRNESASETPSFAGEMNSLACQTSASWNQIASWLRELDALLKAA